MEKFGLGPGIIGRLEILPYARRFRVAGRYHDIAYRRGGGITEKTKADEFFHKLMRRVCQKSEHHLAAAFYYWAVDKFGKYFFRWRKGLKKSGKA